MKLINVYLIIKAIKIWDVIADGLTREELPHYVIVFSVNQKAQQPVPWNLKANEHLQEQTPGVSGVLVHNVCIQQEDWEAAKGF